MKVVKIARGTAQGDPSRGFSVEILYPGLVTGGGDSGIGALARIDRAVVHPGHVVPMHPHRDDEILSYVRSGAMLHRDTVGNEERVEPARLMMMNAGRIFQHEEAIIGPDRLEALQIFMRPREAGLEPRVQFHSLDPVSHGVWRLLAAPTGAPLEVRSDIVVEDARVEAGGEIDLPPPFVAGAARLLYIFSGEAEIDGVRLTAGESALVGDDGSVRAISGTELVLFTTDVTAPVYTGGMFSGNVLAA